MATDIEFYGVVIRLEEKEEEGNHCTEKLTLIIPFFNETWFFL